MPIRQFVSKLTPKGWAAVGGAAAVAVLFLVIVFQVASKPSYSTMLTGLDPAQTGKDTAALDAKGISYQIQNNGTALAVDPSQMAQARIALAGAGLLSSDSASSQPGMSLMDKSQLGASNFQQQITYQRALEGQLAQTIEQIQGISGAQVQLVLPNQQDQLFGDSTPSSAAVLLSDSGTLDPASVRGIAQLVSSSVPNLSSNKVTITDSTGQLLWPTSDSAGGDSSLLAKQSAEARYDSDTAAQVNAMLAQTLGPGKAVAQVNADLNTNQTTADTLAYAKKGVALSSHTDRETLSGSGAGSASGTSGSASNIPGYAATGAGGRSNYNHTITDSSYGVGKTVTHSVISPGAVNRQSVSLLFDQSVPAATQQAVKAAVASAVGLDAKRGDVITAGQLAFTKTAVAKPATPSKVLGYAKYAVVGLGALMFLFFAGRMVRRREAEALAGEPTWLRELDSPRPLAALAGPDAPAMADAPTQLIPTLQPPVNVARQQVEDLVARDSTRVAQQVRAWMAED